MKVLFPAMLFLIVPKPAFVSQGFYYLFFPVTIIYHNQAPFAIGIFNNFILR